MVEADGVIVGIIQRGTWIVIQLLAGSSTPTLVAQFRNGDPALLERVDGDAGIRYSEVREFDVITIPLKNPPSGSPQRKPKVFRLKAYAE